jgi:hypothetical protein
VGAGRQAHPAYTCGHAVAALLATLGRRLGDEKFRERHRARSTDLLTRTGRFVSVRLPTGERAVLATNLHDAAAYPTEEFGALDHRRRGRETFSGPLKGRLELENFSGQTPEAALREHGADHAHPKRVNRAESFHALKRALLPLLHSDTPIAEVVARPHICFAGSPVSVRGAPKNPLSRPAPTIF